MADVPIWLVEIGRSLRESFFMFWETLWPLVFGFALSGAVQAFVSHDEMQRQMGDRRVGSVLRASGFGMASSSCSYAASAMAKSLFVKGADFLAAMVFMFASTNLVIELGIVLVVLMGWQFAVSEFLGGIIMIVLLATFGGLWLRGRLVVQARERLTGESGTAAGTHVHDRRHGVVPGAGDPAPALTDGEPAIGDPVSGDAGGLQSLAWRTRLTSSAGWTDAAQSSMSDINMLKKEMAIGYLVAGLLATVVSTSVWNAVFITGHGFWTTLENVIIGPFIALVSFVCSVGNVPLAAALWSGGISFGGVVSFIFADLITIPLLLIYRKFYGRRLTLRMLVVFWSCMSAAGLIVEGVFASLGLIPTHRPVEIVPRHFAWNYTTYLNIIFLGVFAVMYWLARRSRRGTGTTRALDPTCGMPVLRAAAPVSDRDPRNGELVYFCSDRCHERFLAGLAGDTASAHRTVTAVDQDDHRHGPGRAE